MKKILFSDRYGLTQAVLAGKKTMTRRIIPPIEIDWNRRGRQKHVEGEDTEYIRKEALLEWAREKKDQVSIGLNAYDMGEENGKAEILNALIDKINSL